MGQMYFPVEIMPRSVSSLVKDGAEIRIAVKGLRQKWLICMSRDVIIAQNRLHLFHGQASVLRVSVSEVCAVRLKYSAFGGCLQIAADGLSDTCCQVQFAGHAASDKFRMAYAELDRLMRMAAGDIVTEYERGAYPWSI